MKKLLFILAAFLLSFNFTQAQFSDLAEGYAYSEAIAYVENEGIVNGYPDGTFRPEQKINRAEFVKIIAETVFSDDQINLCVDQKFEDVEMGQWYSSYICIAAEQNFINGYPDGTFRPAENISFAEAAKIITNAFDFDLSQNIEPWYKVYVDILVDKKAIPTSIASFGYEISRGEMSEMIFRIHSNNENKASLKYEDLEVASDVMIRNSFSNKIVYDQGASKSKAMQDCGNRGGEFNECGSACKSDAEVCITLCVYTCENINQESGNNNQEDNMIQTRFEGKIVYDSENFSESQLRADCKNRGGSFDNCGSGCPDNAEVCSQNCVDVCVFEGLIESRSTISNDVEIKYNAGYSQDLMQHDCENRNGLFNISDNICNLEGIIEANFSAKLVYNEEYPQDELRLDCDNRKGDFDACGTGCSEDVDFCAELCTPVCNLDEEYISNLIKVENITEGQTIESPLFIEGQAKGEYFYEGKFPILLIDSTGTVIAQTEASLTEAILGGEVYNNFEATLEFNENDVSSNTNGILVFRKADDPAIRTYFETELRINVEFQ